MKKNTLPLKFLFLIALLMSSTIYSQATKQRTVFGKPVQNISPDGFIRCASTEYEQFLQENNSKRATDEEFEKWLQPLIAKYKQQQTLSSQSGGVIYIPVVVHVIHNGDAYGTNENITDTQVQSQITVMTQDFRRMLGTPGYNTNAVGADTTIEFVLAKVDPNGNPTNGIDRVNLCQASWSTDAIDATVKPATIWDPNLYMNMWSVNFSDGSLLGYAQFPDASGLVGLNASGGSANTDGVVAGYSFFGSSDLATGSFQVPYDKGRTMTHEVGHYLGLRHIWGDNAICPATNTATNKDFCADTPAANAPNFDCPANTDSCPSTPGLDMIQNYMDYTDDTCMNIFTQNQKDRMIVIMNNAARRSTLKTSTKDIAIPLFTNDAEVKIENSCGGSAPTCTTPNPTSPAKTVLLYNRGTANLTASTLSYNMNGGTNFTQNWTGNLAPNQYAVITLTNSTGNGTLNVTVTAANGTDQRASNNTATKVFGSNLPYANATTFIFNLFGDAYGSEITWTLKNQAGTTLYNGGPYIDQTAGGVYQYVTNQSWTLPTNGCYYLTINDSYGDGIFDGTGQGYYTVSSAGTTLVNVTDFVASGNPANTLISRASYFTNNSTLANESFSLTDITLYPNPSKNYFTIDVPNNIVRTGKMEIYNTLGQKVITKAISSDADLTVNTSSLTNGVYFLNLNLGDATKTLRFIKE